MGFTQHLKAGRNTQKLTFKVLSINWKLKRSESQKVPASRQHQAKSASANTHSANTHTHTHTHTHTQREEDFYLVSTFENLRSNVPVQSKTGEL